MNCKSLQTVACEPSDGATMDSCCCCDYKCAVLRTLVQYNSRRRVKLLNKCCVMDVTVAHTSTTRCALFSLAHAASGSPALTLSNNGCMHNG
jgi:hypothetical protein